MTTLIMISHSNNETNTSIMSRNEAKKKKSKKIVGQKKKKTKKEIISCRVVPTQTPIGKTYSICNFIPFFAY